MRTAAARLLCALMTSAGMVPAPPVRVERALDRNWANRWGRRADDEHVVAVSLTNYVRRRSGVKP